jgi:hypothetical protein
MSTIGREAAPNARSPTQRAQPPMVGAQALERALQVHQVDFRLSRLEPLRRELDGA